jgi:hydroxylamine reductase (hybrid-cluster protein)
MFCNQCEQARLGSGCDVQAICGKPADVSDLFDLVVWRARGIAWLAHQARAMGRTEADVETEAVLHPITALAQNPDIQSLLQLLTYGLKGLAAYAEHAAEFEATDEAIFGFIAEALAAELQSRCTGETVTMPR